MVGEMHEKVHPNVDKGNCCFTVDLEGEMAIGHPQA